MNEINLNERNIVKELKNKLYNIKRNKFRGIWSGKKLSNRKIINDEYKNKFGYSPILQPEIDLILQTHDNKLNAIEVKYLTRKKAQYNFSYYFGIGQALALKRYGFDHVGLWLLIDQDVDEEETNRYGSAAWSLIRNDLRLNMEYSYFKVSSDNNKFKFSVMQYKEKLRGFKIAESIEDEKFEITWKYTNEIKCYEKPRFLRNLIEEHICEI